jgi:hypothetical protein
MKTIVEKQVIEDHGETLVLHDVEIAGEKYALKITNRQGGLYMNFNDGEFLISIDKQKEGDPVITFHRHVSRPNHDHDNTQSLLVKVNPEGKTGVPVWGESGHYFSKEVRLFEIVFGGIKVNY